MASVFDPKIGPSGEVLDWDPTQIPPTKPFVHIITSPSGSLITQDNMKFVKTKSLVYTPFHQNAKYINFEIGYQDAKWFDFLSDKWANYANFFIGGFLEAVYSTTEKDSSVVYIQVNAKSIDYDIRFRTTNLSTPNNQSTTSSPNSTTNAFAQRRSKLPSNSPATQKSDISTNPIDTINGKLTKFMNRYKISI